MSLGVVVNQKKADLTPTQVSQYLGMEINTRLKRVFPSPARKLKLKKMEASNKAIKLTTTQGMVCDEYSKYNYSKSMLQ